MMKFSTKFSVALFSVFVVSFFFVQLPVVSPAADLQHSMKQGSFFFSAEEAELLRLSETEWAMPIIETRGVSNGPRIDVLIPFIEDNSNPILKAISPLKLSIVFQENSYPVDMGSLEVVAKKGFFSKSLTDRVKPFVEGTTLKVSGLKIPSGKFKIQIVIADLQGNKTSSEYKLIIKDI